MRETAARVQIPLSPPKPTFHNGLWVFLFPQEISKVTKSYEKSLPIANILYENKGGIILNAELVTCVMIYNAKTNEVLVQNRKKSYPGWSFPGGHVEKGESFCDCAIREAKEETGLDIKNLQYCGVVHWINRESDERYLCFMYKTSSFEGELLADTDEGEQFWLSIDELLVAPKEKFSSVHYSLSPLFHEYGNYSEAIILWSGDESTWEVCYK